MMQIVKRKNKNMERQVKSGPPQREGKTSSEDVRRSLRRRNARYNINYKDYEEDDEEEEQRRIKKVKLVTKIAQERESSRSGYTMAGGGVDEDDNDRDDSDNSNNDEKETYEGTEASAGFKAQVSVSGATSASDSKHGVLIPLPDKKSLELILNKLQKKDVYGVYAAPVDSEELPDYHDIIEHPMDFSTVRKKLGDGSYSTMEQFETDVFLICSNAMQYNEPDTVYHKQARTIQELATKKFQKVNIERSEKESKSMIGFNSFSTKQMEKPIPQMSSEPVRSDFSSGATLATRGDFQNVSNPTQAVKSKKPISTDGPSEPYSSMISNNKEKPDDLLSGNALPSKVGRNSQDENGRTTYTLNQQSVGSDSIFAIFKSELKQLVSVGLHAEYSYARSLARFAGTFGPVAWRVASERIEQALPAGFKYGQGWFGDYEPLLTPVLILEKQSCKEAALLPKMLETATLRKDSGNFHIPVPFGSDFNSSDSVKKPPGSEPTLESKLSSFGSASEPTEGKSYLFDASRNRPSESNNHSVAEDNNSRKNDPNRPSMSILSNSNFLLQNLLSNERVVTSNKKMDHLRPMPFKQPSSSGGRSSFSEVMVSVSNPMGRPPICSPCGQQQHRRETIQVMRPSAEKAQNWLPSPNHFAVDSLPAMPSIPSSKRTEPNSAPQTTTNGWMSIGAAAAGVDKQTNEILSPRRNHISAESLHNLAREHHPQVSRFHGETRVSGGSQLQLEKNGFPALAFGSGLPNSGKAYAEQAQNRLNVYPQLVTADLSRFQMPSPRQILSPQAQLKQKQALSPDLKISFQSSGSPVMQSARVLVDSQQPDLALQL